MRKRFEVVTQTNKKKKVIVDWDKISSPPGNNLLSVTDQNKDFKIEQDTIDFLHLSPDPKHMPVHKFRKCLNKVLVENGPSLLQYGNPMGYEPLREFIANRLRQHNISVTPDEILITNGAQHALELVLKLLVKQGSKVVVEVPTYSRAIPLFQYYKAEILKVPVTREGINLDVLEKIVQFHYPALLYTIPNFQNPTGITTSQAHREKLLKICEKHHVPLVEDGFEEEMKYFGRAILPVKSMDHHGIVLYLGTFSKVLFPGLRVGWIAADKKCIDRLCAIKKIGDLSSNGLNQAALNLFCRNGSYDLHVKHVHKIYRKRMQTALKTAREYIPGEKISYTKPSGGYTIWFELKHGYKSEEEIIKHIYNHGVAVSPGSFYFPGTPASVCFRVSIAHRDENEIEEGIKRLGKALRAL